MKNNQSPILAFCWFVAGCGLAFIVIGFTVMRLASEADGTTMVIAGGLLVFISGWIARRS